MMKKHVKNAHMGTHLLLEVYNVSFEKLNDRDKIEQVCKNACNIEKLKILNTYTHQFDPMELVALFLLLKVTFLAILGQKNSVLLLIFLHVEQKIHVLLRGGY